MTRRPRPATRPPPKSKPTQKLTISRTSFTTKSPILAKGSRQKALDFFEAESDVAHSDANELSSSDNVLESGDESDSDINEEEISHEAEDDDDNNEDADAPRVAQWIDEEDLDAQSDDSEPEEDENEDSSEDEVHHAPFVGPSRSTMQSLEDDLSALPLGMLRNAQRVLQAQDTSEDSGSESNEPSEEDTRRPISSSIKGKDKEIASRKSRNELAKRSNKHAPAEMSSKKPVTRKRTVVEIKSIQPRDPRFLPMTGEFATHKFRQQYGFLSDLHTTELRALRDNLKRARKLLVNSPHDLREEREEEVRRLELAVKRGESSVNRDKREKIEVEALGKIAKEEKERRKQGKAGWWLKGAEKKEVLVKARYEAIANAGGKRAVKKAIEKREKKINQKEKKSRPFARGQSDMKEDTRKRPARFNSGGDRHTKRRKVG